MSDRRAYATKDNLRMSAYYYGFRSTGIREIDEILSAVACAGKSYHHTSEWGDTGDGEPSWAEIIQEAADRAAAKMQGK